VSSSQLPKAPVLDVTRLLEPDDLVGGTHDASVLAGLLTVFTA
jgi:hypothetical protein